MIFGVGIDLIEVDRIEKAISANESFRQKVFSIREINKCETSNNIYQCLAARFAGKEAFMKALGTGWAKGLKWSEIEILNDDDGKPLMLLSGKTKQITMELAVTRINVSLTHLAAMAAAVVILETDSQQPNY